jgi:hypothetical protein
MPKEKVVWQYFTRLNPDGNEKKRKVFQSELCPILHNFCTDDFARMYSAKFRLKVSQNFVKY